MKAQIIKLVYILLIINMGCSNSSKPGPLLEKAFLAHQQSLQTAKEAREILKSLPANDSILLQLESRLNTWDENLIEVPGFEHDHDHGHDHGHHHHHHGPQMELLPEDMLIVQQELLDSVRMIKEALLQYKQVLNF